MKPGCYGYGSEVPAPEMVGQALLCASTSAVGCGNSCIQPWCPDDAQRQALHLCGLQPVLLSLLLACLDGPVGGFPSSPPTATADMGKIRDEFQNWCESPHVTHQAHCCLGVVLERKGNFSLFSHSQSWGCEVFYVFLVLFLCLGKDLGLLLPTHQEIKRKVACGLENEHLLIITLFFSPT